MTHSHMNQFGTEPRHEEATTEAPASTPVLPVPPVQRGTPHAEAGGAMLPGNVPLTDAEFLAFHTVHNALFCRGRRAVAAMVWSVFVDLAGGGASGAGGIRSREPVDEAKRRREALEAVRRGRAVLDGVVERGG